MQPLSSLKLVDKMQLVVFVSRRGTHRAVAALDLVDHTCEWLHYCFDDTSIRLESNSIFTLEQELEKKSVETIHLNGDNWSQTCGGDCEECLLMFHWTAVEFVHAWKIALSKLRDILTIDTSPDNNPDYEEIVDSVRNQRIERRPRRKATGSHGAVVAGRRAIPATGSQIKEESFEIVSPESREEIAKDLEKRARIQRWDERYGDYAMITCAEKLLHAFVPSRTIGDVANDMPKGKGTIYDVLIHVMITYGAFTFAIEDMLKEIKEKADTLGGEISNKVRGSRPSKHEPDVTSGSDPSSRAVKLEEYDTGSRTRKPSREIKEEKAKTTHAKCKTDPCIDQVRVVEEK